MMEIFIGIMATTGFIFWSLLVAFLAGYLAKKLGISK